MYGFRKKLIVLVVALVAVTILFTGLPGIYFAYQKVQDDAIIKIRQQNRLAARELEQQFLHIQNTALALEAVVRSTFDVNNDFKSKESLEQYKEELLPYINEILHLMRPISLWIVFNTEQVEGAHTLSFIDKRGIGIYSRSPEYDVLEKDLKHPGMKWWTDAVKNGETWTEPYYWKNWNIKVVSYSRAVYVDSVLIGCLGSDFNFNQLGEHLDSLHSFKSGHTFLLDQNSNIVYASNMAAPSSYDDAEIITAASKEFSFIKQHHKSYAIVMEKLSNGWTVAASVHAIEFFAEINKMFYTLIAIFAFGFLIAVILALYLSRYVTSPIKSLLKNFRKATEGDLSARSDIHSNDEMQELSDYFNKMMDSLQNSFGELALIQQKLGKEKERAQESENLKSSFLENLSHEVRTPLMSIMGFSELMADPASTPKERQHFFSHIVYNSDQLIKFIEDTLLFSQLEKGQTPVKMVRFKILKVLNELKEEFENRRKKEKPHLFFKTQLNDCEIKLTSDPVLLKKLIRYLLDNAFKFTDKGGITLICRKTDHHFEISISDSGIGISDNKTDMVFEKFCKVIETQDRVYEGAGIGLTNARELTLLLNGTIELSSTLGAGTTVTISFPLP
jgi:signal transduction histidine kinase